MNRRVLSMNLKIENCSDEKKKKIAENEDQMEDFCVGWILSKLRCLQQEPFQL